MIPKQQVLAALRESGVVAVIRTENPTDLVSVSKALTDGGVKFVEITMTVPGALEIIRDAVAQLKAKRYISARARSSTPRPLGRPSLPAPSSSSGRASTPKWSESATPTASSSCPGPSRPHEIFQAWKAGADVVKVFPADIGGPDYIKTIKEPLPQVELLPTKGIDFDTAAAYIKAGAIAVGAGSAW